MSAPLVSQQGIYTAGQVAGLIAPLTLVERLSVLTFLLGSTLKQVPGERRAATLTAAVGAIEADVEATLDGGGA